MCGLSCFPSKLTEVPNMKLSIHLLVPLLNHLYLDYWLLTSLALKTPLQIQEVQSQECISLVQ